MELLRGATRRGECAAGMRSPSTTGGWRPVLQAACRPIDSHTVAALLTGDTRADRRHRRSRMSWIVSPIYSARHDYRAKPQPAVHLSKLPETRYNVLE